MAAGEQDVTRSEVCIGTLCFQKPYSSYVPPPFYPRLPHRFHKWKVQATLTTGFSSQFKLGRVCVLPHCFGLGDDGSWCWRWIPISMLIGFKGESFVQKKQDVDSSSACACLYPLVRLKCLTPALGKLALQPVLELSTVPAAEIRRKFLVGQTTFAIRAKIKAKTEGFPWAIQLTWNSTETDTLQSKLENDVMTLEYLHSWAVSKSYNIVASAAVRMPLVNFQNSFCADINRGSFKVTWRPGSRVSKHKPLPTSAYLEASEKFGQSRTITIAPGHYIDPGNESGAPGEREFNLEIANLVERDLHAHHWKVLRPDRDAPYLSWEEYLNWVSKQGSTAADSRGNTIGVIGDPKTSLNKELASYFGFFDMDWRELGVPHRGGVIVECFNTDEVLQMAPLQRSRAVKCIASQLVDSIQRASSRSRSKETGK